MPHVLVLLMLASAVCLLMGLIKPGLVIRWGAKRTRPMALLYYGGGVVLFFVLSTFAIVADIEHKKTAAAPGLGQAAASAPKAATTKADPMSTAPPRQKSLTEIVVRNLKAYEAADNELKKSAVRRARRDEIARLIATDGIFKGWVGRLKQMGTTGDGNAYVVIDCGPFDLMTTNNEFSATLSEVNTLIPAGSPLFNSVAQLSEGDYVVCTGSFLRSKLDYIEELSLTERGAMNEPSFKALFKSIRPWSPKAE